MSKLNLYRNAVLKIDIPEYNLKKGIKVVPVEYYPPRPDREAGYYIIEVFNDQGKTIAVSDVRESEIESEWEPILNAHIQTFQPLGLLAVILYGSFARGEERKDSDVDLCLVFDEIDSEKKKEIWNLERKDERLEFERKIDRVIVSLDKFKSEWAPIYTSIKKTGLVVWGNMDLTLSEISYKERYAEFYKLSKEVESRKVQSAEDFFQKLESIEMDYLYIPAKHTIQAYLAMLGKGFTSRFEVLHKLTQEELGAEYADMFFYIYELQKKDLQVTKEEFKIALAYAKKILTLYDVD